MVSFKNENPIDVLELFGLLNFSQIEMHMHYFIERDADPKLIIKCLEKNSIKVLAAAGGWCDFFESPQYIKESYDSVSLQVKILKNFSCNKLRLFFGRLDSRYRSEQLATRLVSNLKRLSDYFPDNLFVFENHNGLSLVPEFNAEVFERVNRPNIQMNFDPANFEKNGVDSTEALELLYSHIAHVHLKGMQNNNFCGYGEGDFTPNMVVEYLRQKNYQGVFTLEYEGKQNALVGLMKSYNKFMEMHA